MNSESIKKVTNQAIEHLVEALNAGHSEALTGYIAAMTKFRAYSFCLAGPDASWLPWIKALHQVITPKTSRVNAESVPGH